MTDIASLAAQLQRLQDLEDIRALKYRYAYLANIVDGKGGDLKAFARLFAEDGIFDVGMGAHKGHAAIEAIMAQATTQWQCAMHYMLNPSIQLDGDRATANFTGLFAFTTPDHPAPIWLCNIYSDSFVRTKEGWRFQSLEIKTTFVEPEFNKIYADLLK